MCKIAHNGRLQTCGHPTFRRNNSPHREIMQELAAWNWLIIARRVTINGRIRTSSLTPAGRDHNLRGLRPFALTVGSCRLGGLQLCAGWVPEQIEDTTVERVIIRERIACEIAPACEPLGLVVVRAVRITLSPPLIAAELIRNQSSSTTPAGRVHNLQGRRAFALTVGSCTAGWSAAFYGQRQRSKQHTECRKHKTWSCSSILKSGTIIDIHDNLGVDGSVLYDASLGWEALILNLSCLYAMLTV